MLLVGFDDFERFYVQNEQQGELYFQRLKGRILQITRQGVAVDDPAAVVTPHAEGSLILGRGPLEETGRRRAATLRKDLRFVPVAVAAGLPKDDLSGLTYSYREARMALGLRSVCLLRDRFVAFRDVTGIGAAPKDSRRPRSSRRC